MRLLERLAEEHIRRAMEEGAFDHLPGRGQPLRLVDNPFEPPAWRAAFHVLRSQGFVLPWMEERRQIEQAIASARRELRRAWLTREQDPQGWVQARRCYAGQVEEINRRIREYNLKVPLARFQRGLLDPWDCDTLEAP